MVRHLRVKAAAAAITICFVGALLGAPRPRPTIAVPPPTDPAATQATSRPAWPPIPRDTLVSMYRVELGEKFRPEMADRYSAAHELIERYFESPRSAERKQIVAQLEATGLEPGVLGRLCRIRTYWPQLDAGGVYYVNEKTGVHPTRYFFGVPRQYDRTKSWPLVIKLPTAHAFLTDPPPDAKQVTEIYTRWIKEELDAHPDAAVIMPLLNLDELWGPSYPGMNAAMLPMHHVAGRMNIDPARVYLIGHSMSGHAAWNLPLHYPTYFAATNPLAGSANDSWQRVRIINLRNVLPVVWHDADDQVIKVTAARSMVNALRFQKVNVDYEETKGIGHAPDAATLERCYKKLRARVRELYPASVALQSDRPDTMFNRVDWIQVYQPIDTGKEHRGIFRRGSGTMIYTEKAWRMDATRKGNRIDITTSNVDSFRIYLNDQMLNLREPITVYVNGRPRLEGPVPQSIDEMMKDQVFLGRGWRYFTAALDVDVLAHPPIPSASTRATTRPATVPASVPPATRPGAVPLPRR